LQDLVDHSESEVRLTSGAHRKERLRVAEFIEEMEVGGAADAIQHGLQFSVERVDDKLMIEVDRHLFTCAVSNLLQNAFNFTRVYGHVRLGIRSNADCVSIEIEDECGGLRPGDAEAMFRRFGQRKTDPPVIGRVGLGVSRQAIEADGGRILLRDMPGKGCVYIVAV
jgi:signal transduction histidine kinase